MIDLEEIKRLLEEAMVYMQGIHHLQDIEDIVQREKAAQENITEALSLLENMKDKIKDVIADMDWRGLHNDVIILRRLKDIIPPRTSEEETERMKVRWPKKFPPEEPEDSKGGSE